MRPHFGKMLWRWRPRFGLRALFLVLTMTCVWLATKAERWRGEVVALREVFATTRYTGVTVRGWRGEERLISSAGELRAWETVVDIADGSWIQIDRLEFVLSRLPNIRDIRCNHAMTAADYRTMIAAQREHPNVNITGGPCSKPFSLGWLRDENGNLRRALTDYEYAEREFYLLKGWNVSFMKIPEVMQPAGSTE